MDEDAEPPDYTCTDLLERPSFMYTVLLGCLGVLLKLSTKWTAHTLYTRVRMDSGISSHSAIFSESGPARGVAGTPAARKHHAQYCM